MLDPQIVLHGRPNPPEPWVPLRAGPLDLWFDPDSLSLRSLRLGEREVLRCIYAAVRDRNWDTFTTRLVRSRIVSTANSFHITLDAECRQNRVLFTWIGTLAGEPDGTVRFTFDGTVQVPFFRARLGLCVLHPLAECVGQPCLIEHVDGTHERSEFPRLVSPSQPFRRVRALRYRVAPGLDAKIQFEGDVFETEDERNWTDADFKTYSTPLELPFPVWLEQGTRIQQEVRLFFVKDEAAPTAGEVNPLSQRERVGVKRLSDSLPLPTLSIDLSTALPKPPLGLCFAAEYPAPTEQQIERLRTLKLSHLRVDVVFSCADWPKTLEAAALLADRLGAGLHLALHLSDSAADELQQCLAALNRSRARVLLWLVFHRAEKATSERCVQLAQKSLASFAPGIPIAAGTNANFAELNRARTALAPGVLPCYSLNPQVHVFDDVSLIANLGAQAVTVETAWQLAARPVVVSPVTLLPRFNPNATGPTDAAPGLPPTVDVRQLSLFGAAWTLGSLAHLTGTGRLHSLTFFETIGWRGVMEADAGSPMPDLFPSNPSSVYPLYHVLADLAGFDHVCPLACVPPLRLAGFALTGKSSDFRLLIANLLSSEQSVRLPFNASAARLRSLNSNTADEAIQYPERFRSRPSEIVRPQHGNLHLELQPFAVVCLDWSTGCLHPHSNSKRLLAHS